MRRGMAASVVIFLLLLSAFVSPDSPKPTVDQVAGKLSCFCGTCPHLVVTQCGCSTADQIKSDIRQKINAGMTENQILQSYVDQYGQEILSMPPKKGFNLTAWMLPFLAFLLGGTGLVVFLKRQQKEKKDDSTAPQPPAQAEEDYYRRLLSKEIEERK